MENREPIVLLYFFTICLYGVLVMVNHLYIKPRYLRWHTKQAVLLSILLYGLPGAFLGVWLYEAALWWVRLPDDDSQLDEATPAGEDSLEGIKAP
jgi:hypothetical protein